MSRRTIGGLALLLAAIVLVTMYGLVRETRTVVTNFTKPREQQMDLGTLVTRVQALNRLETTSMRIVHIGTISQSYQYVPDGLAGDQLTLYAVGDVIAGMDMSLLKPTDVHREPNGTIVMTLPPSQILVSRVDNRETHVITRKTGLFRREDPALEGRARQYAEQSIRNEAVRQGILKQASDNGQLRIADLLRTLGFQRVRFETPAALPSRG